MTPFSPTSRGRPKTQTITQHDGQVVALCGVMGICGARRRAATGSVFLRTLPFGGWYWRSCMLPRWEVTLGVSELWPLLGAQCGGPPYQVTLLLLCGPVPRVNGTRPNTGCRRASPFPFQFRLGGAALSAWTSWSFPGRARVAIFFRCKLIS